MNFNIIMTGKGVWKHTTESIKEIREFNPDVNILWVECGEDDPLGFVGDSFVNWIKRPGYSWAEAMNAGILFSAGYTYHILLDDDIICYGPLPERLDLDRETLYGIDMVTSEHFPGYAWPEQWCLVYPDQLWDLGYRFDDNIQASGFNDFDLMMQLSGQVSPIFLPFGHLALDSKRTLSKGYDDIRRANIRYLKEKWNEGNDTGDV